MTGARIGFRAEDLLVGVFPVGEVWRRKSMDSWRKRVVDSDRSTRLACGSISGGGGVEEWKYGHMAQSCDGFGASDLPL